MKMIISFYGINPYSIQKKNIYSYLSLLKNHISFHLLNVIITPYSIEININKNKNIFLISSISSTNLIVYKFIKSLLKRVCKPFFLAYSQKIKINQNIIETKYGSIHKKIEKMNLCGQSVLVFKNILSSFVTIILKKKYVYKIISVKVF